MEEVAFDSVRRPWVHCFWKKNIFVDSFIIITNTEVDAFSIKKFQFFIDQCEKYDMYARTHQSKSTTFIYSKKNKKTFQWDQTING